MSTPSDHTQDKREWWLCPLCKTQVLLHPSDNPAGCHKDGCSNLTLPLIKISLPIFPRNGKPDTQNEK